jgi:hypothetical protein
MAYRFGLRAHVLRIAVCAGLALTPILAQAQTDVSINEAQLLAYGLVNRGQPAAALELIATLQSQGRNQTTAFFIIKSQAERQLGAYSAAIESGKRAFQLAESDVEHYLAARVTAQAFSASERRTRGQFWLRRASQFAPNEGAYANNRKDFEYVRSRNPLSFSLDLGITPSNNLNNAPTTNTIEFAGLILADPTLLPISGLGFTGSGELSYRLPATENRQSEVTIGYDARRVRLGSEASVINPTLQSSDLASDRITLGWSTRHRLQDANAILSTNIDLFADWYGGSHLQNSARARLSYALQISPSDSLSLGATVTDATRQDNALRSYTTWEASAGWSTRFENGGQFNVQVNVSDTNSASFAIARGTIGVQVTYALPNPVAGLELSVSSLYQATEYDVPLYSPDVREDQKYAAFLTAEASNLEYFGFVPVLEIGRTRNISNVSRFDTDETSLSVSFRSSF